MKNAIVVKRSVYLWAFTGLVVIATFMAVYLNKATFREAIGFLTGATMLPALIGISKEEESNEDRVTPTEPMEAVKPLPAKITFQEVKHEKESGEL